MDALNPELPAGADRWPELTADEVEAYGWQIPEGGFGELAQRRLKGASVLVSRVGGLGGMVAFELAVEVVGT